MTRRMTNRYNPYTLNTPIKLNESLVRMEVSKLTPKSNMLMKKMSMVMGVSLGRIPERDLLAAAREKVRLAPHSWQRVAVVPTSVWHAGHSRGRAACGSGRKKPRKALRTRSSLHCQRYGSGTASPCDPERAFL